MIEFESPRGLKKDLPVVRRTDLISEQRSKLPAIMKEQEIIGAIIENDVVLIAGDTGCGKSTQVPQFLFENGFTHFGQVCVTQPRRVAAISVANRVGDELNDSELVGYQVRYDKSYFVPGKTKLKFMTDGILLKEVQSDFLVGKYSTIILDEAHERSVNCDILIGLLSRVVRLRRDNFEKLKARRDAGEITTAEYDKQMVPPLKLVIMSATLRVCDFTENTRLFPTPPPVVNIDAKTYPVTVHFDRYTSQNYVKDCAWKVNDIHTKLPPGSILVFVTGQREVHDVCRMLRQQESKRRRRRELGDKAADSEDEDGSGSDSERTKGKVDSMYEDENSEAEDGNFDDEITLTPAEQAKAASDR